MQLFDDLKDWVKPMPKEFRTPGQLGVTQEQFCALMKVAEGLQSGRLKHHKRGDAVKGEMFDMATWQYQGNCGSVCCIGGWVDTYLGRPQNIQAGSGICDLFYPKIIGGIHEWSRITPEQAARAITNWARTGDPNWKRAMRAEKAS